MKNEIRQSLIEIHIELLEAQLRTLRKLAKGQSPDKKDNEKKMSQMDLVYDILKREGKPLHINEIIRLIEKIHGVRTDRESLASALTKKVVRGVVFVRPDKNTFGLKGEK
jgi:hypothetical protein